VQWLVQDGILEVEGVVGETIDTMLQKYVGMVGEQLQNWMDADQPVKGFRFVRRRRVPMGDMATQGGWSTIEVQA
jgi:hypothetical protein